MSSLRQTVAQQMASSWMTIPHVTQFDEADLTAILELKKKHEAAYDKKGVRLTVTAFILKAVARTRPDDDQISSNRLDSHQSVASVSLNCSIAWTRSVMKRAASAPSMMRWS